VVTDRLLGTRSYLAEPEREVGVSVNLPRIMVLGPQAPSPAPVEQNQDRFIKPIGSDEPTLVLFHAGRRGRLRPQYERFE